MRLMKLHSHLLLTCCVSKDLLLNIFELLAGQRTERDEELGIA